MCTVFTLKDIIAGDKGNWVNSQTSLSMILSANNLLDVPDWGERQTSATCLNLLKPLTQKYPHFDIFLTLKSFWRLYKKI